jgi:uncharacterized protein (TIGR03437 family)
MIDVSAPIFLVAVLLFAPSIEAQFLQTTSAPAYSTASIANTATNLPAGFAPNSIVSIYGSNLAFDTGGAVAGNFLPTNPGGVTVYVGSQPAHIFYISPQQINILIPYGLVAGPTTLTVLRQGVAGPTIPIVLTSTAPGMFQMPGNTVLAVHTDGSLITAASPATPGEVIVIYAIGLGKTTPAQTDGELPQIAAKLANFANLEVLLNGIPLDQSAIQYAGITPGCAGLYQVNLLLPSPLPANPEIRLQIGPDISPAGTILPAQ